MPIKNLRDFMYHGGFIYSVEVYFLPELLTNAIDLLSGDQDGTLMVPCPPYR